MLFRDDSPDSPLMIVDFGLSIVTNTEDLHAHKTTCGTPGKLKPIRGYMAPELIKKTGHGKAVDMWAIGVMTYFL
jgi:calcium/calmodulin-dependent protein kinase I